MVPRVRADVHYQLSGNQETAGIFFGIQPREIFKSYPGIQGK